MRTTRALVLGGGGVSGIGWEAGVLVGLRDGGIDVANWDLVVGTSAGAVVGARLLGSDLDELYASQLADDHAVEDQQVRLLAGRFGGWAILKGRHPRLRWLPRLWVMSVVLRALLARTLRRRPRGRGVHPVIPRSVHARGAPNPELARMGAFGRNAPTASEQTFLEVVATGLLPVVDWPEPLVVTAIDAHDGSLAAFDARSDVPLLLATGASAALPGIFPPVRIGDRRYIDGGMISDANAPLAEGCGEVIVIAPIDRGHLGEELDVLRAAGARATLIRPGEKALVEIGRSIELLDPARRARSTREGREDGLRAAAEIAAAEIAAAPPRETAAAARA